MVVFAAAAAQKAADWILGKKAAEETGATALKVGSLICQGGARREPRLRLFHVKGNIDAATRPLLPSFHH